MGVRLLTFFLWIALICPVSSLPDKPAPGAPIQVRMRTWRLRIRHPEPKYLQPQREGYQEPAPEEAKRLPLTDLRRTRVLAGWEIVGPAKWVPDPDAQVAEVKADLVDEARSVDP